MSKSIALYLLATPKNRYVLFSPPEALKNIESESDDRIRRFIRYLVRHSNRVVAWFGRVMKVGHEYYVQLEDKIDPAERVLKAMAAANDFVVYHDKIRGETDARNEFLRILKRQRWKHIFWLSIDLIISPLGVLLTPIPGPNLFFYYPFLRLLSHYRAISGTTSGLHSRDVQFKSLPETSRVEDNLPGLARFLERMD